MRVKDDPLYDIWQSMRRRCSDPKHVSYRYYGAKGIKVCDRWESFKAFKQDMGERPPGLTLDRKDSKKDYGQLSANKTEIRATPSLLSVTG